MYGTNFQRTIRLLKYLVSHPEDWSRYITTSVRNDITPLDLELPWISYSAIDFLREFVKPDHLVAEFGGGGSTVFFAKRVRKVLCIESNEKWASKIERKLESIDISNVEIETYPYDPSDLESYEESDFLHSIEGNYYNLILVDCFDKFAKLRSECFWFAENYIKEEGCIVVDDSWRYPEIRKNNNAKYWKEFRSIGPCRVGVTTTDIFFY